MLMIKYKAILFLTNSCLLFVTSRVQNIFSTNGLVLEIFENFLIRNFLPRIRIQHPEFSLSEDFHIPRVCDFDFMSMINLRIYMEFDRKNRSGCSFTPKFQFQFIKEGDPSTNWLIYKGTSI